MCSIAGFCKPCSNKFTETGKWKKILSEMNKIQKHRGPDGDGVFLDSDCGLAHNRLSIIDLENGAQPMTAEFNGRVKTVIYNGEIYNSEELKLELEKAGAKFKTKSDTEVVLMGHLIFGENFVEKLNGIFAYAIWNETEKVLMLFRDRLGVKPLFFTQIDETLIFSSEIKGLTKFPGFKCLVDREGLCEIFGLGPARTPGKGVFKNVFEVLPGHFLKLTKCGLIKNCYWKLTSKEHTDSFEETVEKTKVLIADSVEKQMVSDVSVCTFLSGGIDSSVVTAICANKFKKLNKQLDTFSFDFAGNENFFRANSFQPSQDRPWVEKMVDFLKTNHTYLECDTENLIKNLFHVVDATDLPCMVDVEASLLHFCSEVAKTNKVVLTGECADEIFGGYPWFYRLDMVESNTFPWALNLNQRKILLNDDFLDSIFIDDYVKNAYELTVKNTPKLDGENKLEVRRREISYLNLVWFMQTLLNRMDRTSMFVGLEARVPFADHRLVEYVFNVPWKIKCCGGLIKGLLRKSVELILPKEVLYRKKNPYPKTYNPDFEKALKGLILEKINNCNSPLVNFVSRSKLIKFLSSQTNYSKPWFGQLMAGPQMLAYMLQVNYWFEKFKVCVV